MTSHRFNHMCRNSRSNSLKHSSKINRLPHNGLQITITLHNIPKHAQAFMQTQHMIKITNLSLQLDYTSHQACVQQETLTRNQQTEEY